MQRHSDSTAVALMMLLVGLLSLLLVSPSTVDAAPSTPVAAGSINAIYLELFRQSLLAYQLLVPSFSATLGYNSGREGGLNAATSGSWDWVVTTSSVPDSVRAAHPTLESYPIATVGIAPAYNLPTATVGSATLSLTNQAMCRIWRGNITHWSAKHAPTRSAPNTHRQLKHSH